MSERLWNYGYRSKIIIYRETIKDFYREIGLPLLSVSISLYRFHFPRSLGRVIFHGWLRNTLKTVSSAYIFIGHDTLPDSDPQNNP